MVSVRDLLVELGTEELSSKALSSLDGAFLSGIEKGLKAAGLSYAAVHFYVASCHFAVLVEQLAMQQPDRTVNPSDSSLQATSDISGNPTQATLGFVRKYGVDLQYIDKSGPKLCFSQTIAGQLAAGLLFGIVGASLNELPIPKRTRWATYREGFVCLT